MDKGKTNMKQYENSAADKKADKKMGEGTKADYAADKKGLAKFNGKK